MNDTPELLARLHTARNALKSAHAICEWDIRRRQLENLLHEIDMIIGAVRANLPEDMI